MTLLLDTQAFFLMTLDAPELSSCARAAIADPTATCLVSIASLWELAIKDGVGKLRLYAPLDQMLREVGLAFGLRRLSIEDAHLTAYRNFPLHHRDPFDRMIIAQALSENLTVVGNDEAFDAYGVRRIW